MASNSPWERAKRKESVYSNSYRGVQPGGQSSNVYQQNMPTRSEIRDVNTKYQRGADTPGYQAKMVDYKNYQNYLGGDRSGPAPRFTQGPLKGGQILSMQRPGLTATAPNFGQFMGDVGRGISNIAGAFAERGGPLISFGKDVLSGIQNFFSGTPGISGTANVPVFPQNTGGGGGGIDPMIQAQTDAYNALNATQKSIYDMLIKTLPHAEALKQALAQGLPKPVGYMPNYAGLARGGVANL